jgi:two-component system, OmpR family, alkaline phosphatase synthesis response regulator PhoP
MLAAAQCPQLGVRVGMKTILLVDDDQSVRVMYGLVLRRNGYHVLEADSGVVALDMARNHLPDLILSDIIIPGSDGVSLLRKIRDDPDLKSRPFVLMSGSPDLVTSYKGIEAADDFLVKPIGLQELLNCIKTRFLGDPAFNHTSKQERISNENGGSVGLESF